MSLLKRKQYHIERFSNLPCEETSVCLAGLAEESGAGGGGGVKDTFHPVAPRGFLHKGQ